MFFLLSVVFLSFLPFENVYITANNNRDDMAIELSVELSLSLSVVLFLAGVAQYIGYYLGNNM